MFVTCGGHLYERFKNIAGRHNFRPYFPAPEAVHLPTGTSFLLRTRKLRFSCRKRGIIGRFQLSLGVTTRFAQSSDHFDPVRSVEGSGKKV